jgi:hypothetical protein
VIAYTGTISTSPTARLVVTAKLNAHHTISECATLDDRLLKKKRLVGKVNRHNNQRALAL